MTGMRTILLAFLISCIVIAIPVRAAEDDDPLVTIRVLTKQARLLREGVLKQISISLRGDSCIIDETDKRSVTGKTVTIQDDHGRILFYIDSKPVTMPAECTIMSRSGDGVCSVKLAAEERIFSLPFSVKSDSTGLRFYARERLSRYAVDSALAEYGREYRKDTEAVLALAQVISTRYFYMRRAASHRDADFCDLTHCQVYRGRMESGIALDSRWSINHEKLPHNLFFHSRCGGNTFDDRVFSNAPRSVSTGTAVRDRLYREGEWLCRGADSRWERSISREDLRRIIDPGRNQGDAEPLRIEYDRTRMRVHVQAGGRSVDFPVETFRLKINRIRGWNFIRSNNFIISEETVNEPTQYRFRGEGLGHGVGLCQHGAVALSRRGYNRFEILEHYFPDLTFEARANAIDLPPFLSYCMFDLSSGKMLGISHGQDFLRRKVPPGSIFKLVVALYLAAERPDIFNNYTYTCPGKNPGDRHLPDRCWNPKGHGPVKIEDALSHSCNLYFSSLYDKISEKRFRIFFERLCRELDISAVLPEISDGHRWSEFLAGLDFRLSFTIRDYMRLAAFMNCGTVREENINNPAMGIPLSERLKILRSLRRTFIDGTASGKSSHDDTHGIIRALEEWEGRVLSKTPTELWGKTATISDGSNKQLSHGLFIGGSGTTGIVVLCRRVNGHTAARWARMVLLRYTGGE